MNLSLFDILDVKKNPNIFHNVITRILRVVDSLDKFLELQRFEMHSVSWIFGLEETQNFSG